jgi:hypothetical protein
MQYISKLATSQSKKPRSPFPKYEVMYPVDAHMQTVKISSVQKIVRYMSEFTALYGPCEQINTFPSTHICLLLNCLRLHI